MKKLLAAVILGLVATAGRADYLYWTIETDSDGKVTGNAGTAITEFYSSVYNTEYAGTETIYAQIFGKVTGSSDGYTALDKAVLTGKGQDVNIGSSSSYESYIIRLYNASEEVAFSDALTYSSLIANNSAYIYGTLDMKVSTAWVANGETFHAAPEPTSGLLFLLGLAGLALKRKRA